MHNDCKNCIHLNVCAYVMPDIPTCDSFLSKDILDKIIDEWNQCGHMDYIQSVKSNCDIVTDTIGKLQKKFWSQEKGDISDAKPE